MTTEPASDVLEFAPGEREIPEPGALENEVAIALEAEGVPEYEARLLGKVYTSSLVAEVMICTFGAQPLGFGGVMSMFKKSRKPMMPNFDDDRPPREVLEGVEIRTTMSADGSVSWKSPIELEGFAREHLMTEGAGAMRATVIAKCYVSAFILETMVSHFTSGNLAELAFAKNPPMRQRAKGTMTDE